MKSLRVAGVLLAIAAPIAASAVIAGCDQGSPARPDFQLIEASAQDVGVIDASICPDLDASFASIREGLLDTFACGATRGGNGCHSAEGRDNAGLLDYSVDAAALYSQFIRPDGGSVIAANLNNVQTPRPVVYRVVPGDADASLLYIKLNLLISNDPVYGGGMPRDHLGSVCPTSAAAVADWINSGAKFAPDHDAAIDDGSVSDAKADAGDAAD